MSLDVSLTLPCTKQPKEDRIFIREDGQTRHITRAEWDTRFPDREPIVVAGSGDDSGCVYSANITHNLNTMAGKAGIYQVLWRPEEIGITHAWQLIVPLRDGLAKLNSDPEYFRQFNSSNGWGPYEGLAQFAADYLAACEQSILMRKCRSVGSA